MFLKLVVFIWLVAESARAGLASQAPRSCEANPQGYGSRIPEHGVSTSGLQSWNVTASLNNGSFDTCNSRVLELSILECEWRNILRLGLGGGAGEAFIER